MKAIILAAGKGTRLAQDGIMLPKVLRRANDKPLLGYVLDSIDFIDNNDITIVAGYMKEAVMEEFSNTAISQSAGRVFFQISAKALIIPAWV